MNAEGGRRKEIVAAVQSFILHPSGATLLAFVLGAISVIGYAPYYMFPLPVVTLAGLIYLWSQAGNPRAAALSGFAFGLGLFLFGASWVYVSLHDFGAMPAPLAAIATLLFCVILALFPAGAGYACARPRASRAIRFGLLAPAAWTLAEWMRGWVFTGFPWLATGYSQIPESPLAGYAPLLGIYGVTLATAASAGLIVVLGLRSSDKARGLLHPSALILLALWAGGWGLSQIAWTTPVGAPFNTSLLQGNVAQDQKWREERVRPTLEIYRLLTESAPGKLIILPETALPLFLEQVPQDYLAALAASARARDGDILIGVAERTASGEYFNSVVSLGSAPQQAYRKSHLVPFGEFIPLRPVLAWIVNVLAIPLQDFSRGAHDQQPLAVAGQRVAINICYEDAFGEEIIRQLPEATVLANVSNVAWFGRSLAPRQHLQIAQARAIETGRSMLRATNTGVTAVIGPRGEVLAAAPEFEIATVTYAVQGYGGATPYVRWGNYAMLGLCVVLISVGGWLGRRAARSAS
ncbi:MAG TPA: apolipoprotein N-acyltransferase [Burkholderiales bacterium]|nr:apolipoprotein N-acyltransferase [Burkholderiales bacterium]